MPTDKEIQLWDDFRLPPLSTPSKFDLEAYKEFKKQKLEEAAFLIGNTDLPFNNDHRSQEEIDHAIEVSKRMALETKQRLRSTGNRLFND